MLCTMVVHQGAFMELIQTEGITWGNECSSLPNNPRSKDTLPDMLLYLYKYRVLFSFPSKGPSAVLNKASVLNPLLSAH